MGATNYSSMAINSESLRNGCASNIVNPDKTMHSASASSLSDVASTSISANEAAETIVPEWKNIENASNR